MIRRALLAPAVALALTAGVVAAPALAAAPSAVASAAPATGYHPDVMEEPVYCGPGFYDPALFGGSCVKKAPRVTQRHGLERAAWSFIHGLRAIGDAIAGR